MKIKQLYAISAASLAVATLTSACVSTSDSYQAYDEDAYFDDSAVDFAPRPSRVRIAGSWFEIGEGVGDLNRIELAQIASRLDTTTPDDDIWLLRNAASTDNAPAAIASHEDTMAAEKASHFRARKHLNNRSYDAQRALSVNQSLPEGWIEDGDKIRHVVSGLGCDLSFSLEDDSGLALQQLHEFDQSGTNVGCSFETRGGATVTLYATYAPDVSQEDHANGAAASIAERFQTTTTLPLAVSTVTDDQGTEYEKPSAIAFDITPTDGPVPLKSSLWVVKTGGWHVKARATYRQDDIPTEIMSLLMFTVAHIEVRATNGNEIDHSVEI